MPTHRLDHLWADEVSLVGKAANRRRFLLRKADTPMFDEVKALQALEKLDAQGDGDLVVELVKEDAEADVNDQHVNALPYTDEEKRRLKAALRLMGPGLASKVGVVPWANSGQPPGVPGDPSMAQAPAAPAASPNGTEGGNVSATEPDEDKKKLPKGPGLPTAKSADLPAEVVERLAKADADLAKAEKELADLKYQREREVYIKKAAELGDALPGASADDLGGILLKTAGALTSAEQSKLEKVLADANRLLKQSALFREIGSSLGEGSGEPGAKVQAMAEEVRKEHPEYTVEQARAAVLKSHPELMAELNKAHDERVRKARG